MPFSNAAATIHLTDELNALPPQKSYLTQLLEVILIPLGLTKPTPPPYNPTNMDWEITFRALNLDHSTVCKLYNVFHDINKSGDGEVSYIEFMHYFNFVNRGYVKKAFNYCDTIGGGELDFLEFVVSVTNFCTLDVRTLGDFTFDLYDGDDDGELVYDDIILLMNSLFGSNWKNKRTGSKSGKKVFRDLLLLSEKHSGSIPIDAFTRFHINHSLLLFPAFQIQRAIQKKVLGLNFWMSLSSKKKKTAKYGERKFERRHVQAVLRAYKTGSAAAILTHTGDPNEALRDWIAKGKDEVNRLKLIVRESGVDENGDFIDPAKQLQKELAQKRAGATLVIKEWRSRVNPSLVKTYKLLLIAEEKERRAAAQIELERMGGEEGLKRRNALEEIRVWNLKVDACRYVLEQQAEFMSIELKDIAEEFDLYDMNVCREVIDEETKLERGRELTIIAYEKVRNLEIQEEDEIELLQAIVEEERLANKKDQKYAFFSTAIEGAMNQEKSEDKAAPLIMSDPPIGSNGRPKKSRRNRGKNERAGGRFIDRPSPEGEAPEGVEKIGPNKEEMIKIRSEIKLVRRKSSRALAIEELKGLEGGGYELSQSTKKTKSSARSNKSSKSGKTRKRKTSVSSLGIFEKAKNFGKNKVLPIDGGIVEEERRRTETEVF